MDIGYIVLAGLIIAVVAVGWHRFRHWDSVEIDGVTYHIDGNGDNSGVDR